LKSEYWPWWFVLALGVYVILLVGDFVTTLMNGPVLLYLESNPLFLLLADWPVLAFVAIAITNVLLIALLLFCWARQDPFHKIIVMTAIIVVCVFRVMAMNVAITVYNAGVTVDMVQGLFSPEERLRTYLSTFYVPFIIVLAIVIALFVLSRWLLPKINKLFKQQRISRYQVSNKKTKVKRSGGRTTWKH
jgi:hypothetical protein